MMKAGENVQCSCSGWPTGNGKKLSNSQACCLTAVPGCCLVSFHILWAILSTSTVHVSLGIRNIFCCLFRMSCYLVPCNPIHIVPNYLTEENPFLVGSIPEATVSPPAKADFARARCLLPHLPFTYFLPSSMIVRARVAVQRWVKFARIKLSKWIGI